MKVRELIKELEGHDPEALVVCQKDSEGNGYSPLSGLWVGVYVPYDRLNGEVRMHPEDLDEVTRRQGFTEEDTYEESAGTPRCVVLNPLN